MTPRAVPGSLGEVPATLAEAAEAVVEEVLEFQPRPGGMVDRHRRDKARREALEEEQRNTAEPVTERAVQAVKVAQVSPEVTSLQQVTVPAGGTAMLLPMSTQRSRALVSSNIPLLLSRDSGAAAGGAGFVLPAGLVMEVKGRAQLWGSLVPLPLLPPPVFSAAGIFTQNPFPVPVQVTFIDGVHVNVYGGGGGTAEIGLYEAGPASYTIGPYQAIGWNDATTNPTTWTWSLQIAGYPASVSVASEYYAAS